ncbi:hypothetical protein MKP05_09580 [Halomonas sp. EGI 63088]|uniref:Uncharacterized protein n=1 Tax=Halomonas flagellata TaxID=2920385 RepID=A0ABS9RU40_9GAMM|nr:hypothetical protein [Halomonas flagellata]MCH4563379.1 hypothetical protein [Halomonas flagellata]
MSSALTLRTLTLDPATGDTVTLEQLAERHDLKPDCVLTRYRNGKRGALLVESVAETRRRAGREAATTRQREGRKAVKVPAPSRRELADAVLATREGRLASRRLGDYAA